ncbi:MAG: SCO family protein [Opitutaceae bacterium]|nr:SCO family protein [Opitutaceae bacterium]
MIALSRAKLFSACLSLAVLAAAGCGKKSGEAAATAPADDRRALTGTVISLSAERGTALVDHEEIPGYMPRMTMEFRVTPGDLKVLREGLRIRGKMYELSGDYYLEEIWPVDPAAERIVQTAGQALRQDTVTRGASPYREVGEFLPDFALYDQDGKVVQITQLRGRQIVLNFIFTRCPDAKMCPATVMKMMQLQAMAREAGVADLELVSITLDPEYDTPGVLRDYADSRGIDTSNYHFLTGPERAIKDMLAQLGVLVFQNGPLLQHTLATVLIDPRGKIVHRVDGSEWRAEDFAGRLRRAEGPKTP